MQTSGRKCRGVVSALFIIYRCLVGFCVLNVVSAVFVQQTMMVAQKDQALFVQQRMRQTEEYTKRLKDVFRRLDISGDGVIQLEEFIELLDTPTMSYFMANLELESSDMMSLFSLMDTDGSGTIDLDEFMEGCKRLKGTAKSVDVALILAHTARMNVKLDTLLGPDSRLTDDNWGYGSAGGKRIEELIRSSNAWSTQELGIVPSTWPSHEA
eukprot:TRINITY_DN34660_c0_g1_i1.p1 TRINITY_DN34660_c0_g1~~TRINITY_DN34660_c0_g1_i1.p1  ORF type:complete len:211 (+),score=37.93 TRINITY_DN34660_c0_g1_i1:185-817(+)